MTRGTTTASKVVGERVLQARTENKMTEEDLSKRLRPYLDRGIPSTTVTRIEEGRYESFDLDLLMGLAHVLNRPVSFFMNQHGGFATVKVGTVVLNAREMQDMTDSDQWDDGYTQGQEDMRDALQTALDGL